MIRMEEMYVYCLCLRSRHLGGLGDRSCCRRIEFRPFFQKRRAGCNGQNRRSLPGAGFLDMFCPNYKGQRYYVDIPSVSDGSLITASGTGALLWAKQIIERLGVFQSDTLEACGMRISVPARRSTSSLLCRLCRDRDPYSAHKKVLTGFSDPVRTLCMVGVARLELAASWSRQFGGIIR